jgi:hypothetical protein
VGGVDDPELCHAGFGVEAELLAEVATRRSGREDLDHEVGERRG